MVIKKVELLWCLASILAMGPVIFSLIFIRISTHVEFEALVEIFDNGILEGI